MKRVAILTALAALTALAVPADAWAQADQGKRAVDVQEVAPPLPEQMPRVGERRTARVGDVLYTERATGLPGARLEAPLTLKNTPAGRVTITPEDNLRKTLLDGEPWYCALHTLRARREERIEAGFHICLRDGDGAPETLESVRIVMVVLTVLDRERSGREITTKYSRTHELAATGRISPKAYRETTVEPDDGAYFEASLELKEIDDGQLIFQSELHDMEGERHFRSAAVEVDVSGPFPKAVHVPHPFDGKTVYVLNRGTDLDDGEADKQQRRAARLEILSVDGETVTYRMTRAWQPWRSWSTKSEKRIRWRQVP